MFQRCKGTRVLEENLLRESEIFQGVDEGTIMAGQMLEDRVAQAVPTTVDTVFDNLPLVAEPLNPTGYILDVGDQPIRLASPTHY